MERIKTSFMSSDLDSETELEAYVNHKGDLYISIDSGDGYCNGFITLNTHTAIKLVKHLKKEIAIMKDGGINGNI